MSCLCDRYDLWNPLRERIQNGMPTLGTCAGMIMLAHDITGASQNIQQKTLDVLDISVARNAYGRQIDSFEADLAAPALGEEPLHAVFIRAPQISRVGDGVQILASFHDQPVAVRCGNIVAATFHPEMSDDVKLHRYWLELLA
jgi:5'-phosphate synthase pdxT subunit